MTLSPKHIGLGLTVAALAVGLLAFALSRPGMSSTSAQAGSETPMAESRPAIPAIDAAQPAVTETATFALG